MPAPQTVLESSASRSCQSVPDEIVIRNVLEDSRSAISGSVLLQVETTVAPPQIFHHPDKGGEAPARSPSFKHLARCQDRCTPCSTLDARWMHLLTTSRQWRSCIGIPWCLVEACLSPEIPACHYEAPDKGRSTTWSRLVPRPRGIPDKCDYPVLLTAEGKDRIYKVSAHHWCSACLTGISHSLCLSKAEVHVPFHAPSTSSTGIRW